MEAPDALRSLIEKVVLTPEPDAPDGLAAELHGDLAMILAAAAGEPSGDAGRHEAPQTQDPRWPSVPQGFRASQLSVVAGNRSHHNLRRIDELAAHVKAVAGKREHLCSLFKVAA